MNKTHTPRLVKAIYVYDDGSTSERNWPQGKRVGHVRLLARNESGSVREFTNHYQALLRIEKGKRESLTNDELFHESVIILSRLLVLRVDNS